MSIKSLVGSTLVILEWLGMAKPEEDFINGAEWCITNLIPVLSLSTCAPPAQHSSSPRHPSHIHLFTLLAVPLFIHCSQQASSLESKLWRFEGAHIHVAWTVSHLWLFLCVTPDQSNIAHVSFAENQTDGKKNNKKEAKSTQSKPEIKDNCSPGKD